MTKRIKELQVGDVFVRFGITLKVTEIKDDKLYYIHSSKGSWVDRRLYISANSQQIVEVKNILIDKNVY